VSRGRTSLSLNRRISLLMFAAVACMIPWIIYLGLSLPEHFDARNWNVLWIGFDVALIAALGYTGYAAWFQRTIVLSTALVTGTLLLCDAWFDVVTDWGTNGLWLSLLTAIGAEIPLALFFFWLARRIMRRIVGVVHDLSGGEGPTPRNRAADELLKEMLKGAAARREIADPHNP